jgi:DNA invertase Pin-like site-specific DNA recombinase
LIGYGRVSTDEQNLDLQLDALEAAGCKRVFRDVGSGLLKHRPQLDACFDYCGLGTRWWSGASTGWGEV